MVLCTRGERRRFTLNCVMTGVRTLYSSDSPVSDSCQSSRAGLRCDMSDMLLLLHRHVIINTEHSHLRQSSCLYFVQFCSFILHFQRRRGGVGHARGLQGPSRLPSTRQVRGEIPQETSCGKGGRCWGCKIILNLTWFVMQKWIPWIFNAHTLWAVQC